MKAGRQRAAAPVKSEEKHVVNGWALYTHPKFDEQYETLIAAVEAENKKDQANYQKTNAAKILSAVQELIEKQIPADPTDKKYRQGDALGAGNKNWFRAKFYGQFRLFFRFDSKSKTIVYAWLNDEDSLRAYDSKTDAYATFQKMLAHGNPPKSFDDLLKVSGSIAGKK